MRRDDQAVELVVGVVGKRKHRPVLSAFARAHFDAANDAVGARCGGNLNAVGFAALMVQHGGEIDGGRIAAHAHGIDRMCDREPCEQRADKNSGTDRQRRKAPE